MASAGEADTLAVSAGCCFSDTSVAREIEAISTLKKKEKTVCGFPPPPPRPPLFFFDEADKSFSVKCETERGDGCLVCTTVRGDRYEGS